MNSTKYSISAAHRITGKSRTTITAHINSGKLSVTEDDDGNKVIDASELIRVYGDACDFGVESQETKREDKAAVSIAKTPQAEPDTHFIKELLENERQERKRERDLLQKQIDNLQDSLKLAQEGHNRATLLLEDKSGDSNQWQAAISAIESRVANQEDKVKEEQDRAQKILRQNQALKKALDEEKNKSFWQKLFG